MQLDKFSDYALRVLMVLSVRRPEMVSVRQIAEIFDISENHVAKIATTLVQQGWVISKRGRAGGLSLAMEPEDIFVGGVLRKIKKDTPVAECFGDNKSCQILPACGLRNPLLEAQEAFLSTLDAYSIADLTRQKTKLMQLIA
jgi:Rrf2 family nitric oxide-sensitive transcriptional repressor